METTQEKKPFNYSLIKTHISDWLKKYATNAGQHGYVIGVSGGIDSAVCSTLCAMTGLPLFVVRMSIHQELAQADRAAQHIEWLKASFPNIVSLDIDLTEVFDKQMETLDKSNVFPENTVSGFQKFLVGANTRSRLRMVTLYGIAGAHKLLVCGTGNKVEDYGIGFFTKFGDGGVDVSPIGELLKSEVYSLGKELGVIQSILNARPTDGLWDDGKTDEDQIGATYDELEWAMSYYDKHAGDIMLGVHHDSSLTDRQTSVLEIYLQRHDANAHKMSMPPVCNLSKLNHG